MISATEESDYQWFLPRGFDRPENSDTRRRSLLSTTMMPWSLRELRNGTRAGWKAILAFKR